MRGLHSTDPRAAQSALVELNGIRSWFDWQSFAPKTMAPAQKKRFVQVLLLMAGTNSLGEARSAYRVAFEMLRQNDAGWQWEAA